MQKYQLTNETRLVRTASGIQRGFRIRATARFCYRTDGAWVDVEPGDLGGFVGSVDTLSQDGRCWVAGNAVVTARARVGGNAVVMDNAVVDGTSRLDGFAVVMGDARVLDSVLYGASRVRDEAHVIDSRLSGNAAAAGRSLVFQAVMAGRASVSDNAYVQHADLTDSVEVGDSAFVSGDVRKHIHVGGCTVLFSGDIRSSDQWYELSLPGGLGVATYNKTTGSWSMPGMPDDSVDGMLFHLGLLEEEDPLANLVKMLCGSVVRAAKEAL